MLLLQLWLGWLLYSSGPKTRYGDDDMASLISGNIFILMYSIVSGGPSYLITLSLDYMEAVVLWHPNVVGKTKRKYLSHFVVD